MLYILSLVSFLAGLACGYWLFTDLLRRPLLKPKLNRGFISPRNLAGTCASVVLSKQPHLIPQIIFETGQTLVFKHPRPKHTIHYMFVPKRDIENIGALSEADREAIVDLFACMVLIIERLAISDYKIWSNGPDKQDVGYLHFHLGCDAASNQC